MAASLAVVFSAGPAAAHSVQRQLSCTKTARPLRFQQAHFGKGRQVARRLDAVSARQTVDSETLPSSSLQLSRGNNGARPQSNIAVLRASKTHSVPVKEQARLLADYMTLPASQYSVLDANRIERTDENTFKCYVGGISFFSLTVEPVLEVSVHVQERGPIVKLLSTQLQGSPMAEAANDKFDATMTNVVTWHETGVPGEKAISSDTHIEVRLKLEGWISVVPRSVIESTGNRVLQGVLGTMVPRFLKQLRVDYELWAAGDDSRKPVGTGQI